MQKRGWDNAGSVEQLISEMALPVQAGVVLVAQGTFLDCLFNEVDSLRGWGESFICYLCVQTGTAGRGVWQPCTMGRLCLLTEHGILELEGTWRAQPSLCTGAGPRNPILDLLCQGAEC